MLKRWIIVISACLLVFSALASYKFFEIKTAIAMGEAYPEPSETVVPYITESIEFQPTLLVIGELVAPHRLDLHNELAGKITALHFQSGDQVQAGQVLLELDSREEQARLKAAKANAKLAELTLQRIKKLRQSKRVSAEAYDQAAAQYQTTQAEIAQLEVQISKKILLAPFNARAGIQNLELGQYLASNSLITKLIGLDDYIWLDFKLPQGARELELGETVTVMAINYPGSVQATIIAQDSLATGKSRQLKYRAKLSNTEARFKPRTMVSVKVANGSRQQRVRVPDSAISHDQFGQYVFILEADKNNGFRARRIAVKLGPKLGDYFTVISGLKINQLIAAKGAFKLRPGLKVHTVDNNVETGGQ